MPVQELVHLVTAEARVATGWITITRRQWILLLPDGECETHLQVGAALWLGNVDDLKLEST